MGNTTFTNTPGIAATIDLPKVEDERGNLSFIEEGRYGLSAMRRAYWIYDVPGGEVRGSHALCHSSELIVALSGSFDVVLRDADGVESRTHLCRSYKAVRIPPRTWRTLDNFSTNSLALVLADSHYDPDEYIWDIKDLTSAPATYSRSVPDCPRPAISSDLSAVRLVELSGFTELRRGCLSVVEEMSDVFPCPLRRVFYIYDIPSGAERGAHAHRRAWQFIVAAGGAFDVAVDDGRSERTFRLDRPFRCLLVPPGLWCRLHDFSSASVALVLTSEPYDRDEYILDRASYLSFRNIPC